MKIKLSKKAVLVVTGIALISLSVAFWYGGQRKWELMMIGPNSDGTTSISAVLKEKLKESPDDPILKYNLAHFYFRQSRYQEAEKLLAEILSEPGPDNEVIEKASFNLGNTLFREGEKKEQLEASFTLLKKSLEQYRSVLDLEKEQQRFTGQQSDMDEDARYNYSLVKMRLKILADRMEKERKKQEQKKALFVLLKDLLGREKQIGLRLEVLGATGKTDQHQAERQSLLNLQVQNLEQLKTIKGRIKDLLQPKTSQNPTAPTI
jgi:tetratricopeptide (TPR) repeat protein